ncbi:hypothetical protein CBF36_07490 [Vagococcus bubulae]|uniref:DUF2969 domain-containing protein n=2 Tax=Vagococcus bubulae TaxID=1977868 RepID=A0A429ZIF5_9ENTE|nr:hypothetical protein CBF36_07490 [Vagococcus bubulae]
MVFYISSMHERTETLQMKKNKPVEVEIKELSTHDELLIGKKMIGKVTKLSDKKFQVETTDGILGVYKTQDDAYEEALKYWNLNN